MNLHIVTADSVDDVDNSSVGWEVPEEIEDLRPGTRVNVVVSVYEASGLPAAYSHNLFCQYKFWNQAEALIIPPLIPTSTVELQPHSDVHQFQHEHKFTVEVTEDFLEYIEDGALAVEVWGHRRSGFDSMPDTGR